MGKGNHVIIKKITWSLIILLLFAAPSAFGQPLESFQDAIGRKQTPNLSAEQQRWLLALPAIIMDLNRSSHTTLEVAPLTEANREEMIKLLQDWWGGFRQAGPA